MSSLSGEPTSAIKNADTRLQKEFEIVAKFLDEHDEFRPARITRAQYGTRQYYDDLARSFVRGRQPIAPKLPATVPDPLVSVIMHEHFRLPKSDLERAKHEHKLSMASEDFVGELLERYIASEIEPLGWVWCSGEVVRSIDFVRESEGGWEALQVKNRDNSENSSSARVRHGTTIKKWYRTNSKTGATRWPKFPDPSCAGLLSEDGFNNFVARHLAMLPRKPRN
jgi:hypothetical protein